MATVRRIGFGTIFELENDVVGIGTDNPTHKLQALGNIRSEAATDIGISTLSTYQGFVNKEARFTRGQIDIESQSGSTSGEIVIDGDVTVSSATTFTSGPQNLTVTDTFTLPSGDTNSREDKPTPGSLRFNQDFATLEFYTGNNWATVNTFTEIQNSPGNRGRVVLAGGYTDVSPYPALATTDFLNISTLGNSQSFGNLVLSAKYSQSGCSDGIRGLFQGGQNVTDIEYITIASGGDSIDFGNLTSNGNHNGSLASSTRGIRGGGYSGSGANTIDYVQIQTLGNSLDFGDLLEINYGLAGMASPTRGIFAGGRGTDTPLGQTTINQITISSTGNAVNFGNMSARHSYVGGFSNSIRGFIVGGTNPRTNTIQFLTIASSGSMKDFGDLTIEKEGIASGSSNNHVRGLACAGQNASGAINHCDFITIATTGNATDFGDSVKRAYGGALSDSHGGLGGF